MRIVIGLGLLALAVYCVIDCVGGEKRRRLGLPTWLWVLVIIALPGLGPLLWLLLSRTYGGGASSPRRPARPVAPDDDPAFLADLDRHSRPGTGEAAPEDPPSGEEQGTETGTEQGSEDDDGHTR
ncbi:PLDc N-terminal domain-containing protein [Ruania suaedae]|uniref:PLDc N-terminal domain-containing protein n=1 Tax=Ruania suaedae TaxID=2897774 RepID=UPI001E32CFE1|nr:PLDc N-terminal domain-containing protein [Ruania suaedae]UFU02498.1 PLDc N-terminal domain-containing protein [Ruania suaedae]